MASPAARRTARGASAFRCSECGWQAAKWAGRCGECQAWGSVSEVGAVSARTTAASTLDRPAIPIGEVDVRRAVARPTGVPEFDRVLGGGIVPGAVVLVAGEPGATVLGQIETLAPELVVVDSVQTISSADVEGSAGNVTQVREVAASLIQAAKSKGIAVLLVGHVTKDGSIAGPRVLEHLVDVVVQFEGERHSRLRLVRAVKNRFGPTDEVGCFDLSDVGIVGLADPSGLFLSGRTAAVPGTCVTVTLEGRRPLVAEVQALVTRSSLATPRRATSGLDAARVNMIVAVLDKRAEAPIAGSDAYLSTVGGVRLSEPAADLAISLALAGAITDRPLPHGTIAFGEVGLAGEIRPVTGAHRRLAEAARLGFTRAVVPRGVLGAGPVPGGLRVVEAATVGDAVVRGFHEIDTRPDRPPG
ncbi:MAG: repair protein RadA [Ornithinibacter sp.]|nr:repair protein RadA [Ornithinibacter sp.]